MALYRMPSADAATSNIGNMANLDSDIDYIKMMCQDPWLTMAIILIMILGLFVYLIKNCKQLMLIEGYKYANHCTLFLFVSFEDRYVPIRIKSTGGILYL